jgi:hypothetical protein
VTRADLLPGFRGDLAWLHAREGHNGRPYWPAGKSGVTLDPGLDLHHADWTLVESVLKPHLTASQLRRLKVVRHLMGPEAKPAAKALSDIRISRELASELLPQVADPYWRTLVRRFPGILDGPPAAHTALLSLAYNRGAGNRALSVLRPWIAAGDWAEVGREIRRMQQDHKLSNIRERRVLEGDLILAAVGEKA